MVVKEETFSRLNCLGPWIYLQISMQCTPLQIFYSGLKWADWRLYFTLKTPLLSFLFSQAEYYLFMMSNMTFMYKISGKVPVFFLYIHLFETLRLLSVNSLLHIQSPVRFVHCSRPGAAIHHEPQPTVVWRGPNLCAAETHDWIIMDCVRGPYQFSL